jgi:hypothetical protein
LNLKLKKWNNLRFNGVSLNYGFVSLARSYFYLLPTRQREIQLRYSPPCFHWRKLKAMHPHTLAERRFVDRKNAGDDYAKPWRYKVNRHHRYFWGWVQDRARRNFRVLRNR